MRKRLMMIFFLFLFFSFFFLIFLFHLPIWIHFVHLTLTLFHIFQIIFESPCHFTPQVIREGESVTGVISYSHLQPLQPHSLFSSLIYTYLHSYFLPLTTTAVRTFAITQQKEVQCTCGNKGLMFFTKEQPQSQEYLNK